MDGAYNCSSAQSCAMRCRLLNILIYVLGKNSDQWNEKICLYTIIHHTEDDGRTWRIVPEFYETGESITQIKFRQIYSGIKKENNLCFLVSHMKRRALRWS